MVAPDTTETDLEAIWEEMHAQEILEETINDLA
jgi:hypothetical protein